jgi:hypothetical protein
MMKSQFSRWGIVLIAVTVAAGAVVYALTTRFLNSSATSAPPANALMIIAPYKHAGTWVFDDDRMGLVREPFVAGVPEMIDVLVKDIPNAANGFRLLFSAQPFPGHQKKLTWVRGDSVGNYYRLDEPPMEGWLCPAMFRYYPKPPPEIYTKAEAIK